MKAALAVRRRRSTSSSARPAATVVVARGDGGITGGVRSRWVCSTSIPTALAEPVVVPSVAVAFEVVLGPRLAGVAVARPEYRDKFSAVSTDGLQTDVPIQGLAVVIVESVDFGALGAA